VHLKPQLCGRHREEDHGSRTALLKKYETLSEKKKKKLKQKGLGVWLKW
jgi:antibiotic biosynthesis monooxygenase (ABM) superfamily enzyme